MRFNLVFHDIQNEITSTNDIFSLTPDFIIELDDLLQNVMVNNFPNLELCYYFDDALQSFEDYILSRKINLHATKIYCAVPITVVNKAGHLSSKTIKKNIKEGFIFLPHGYSHAALAVYDNNLAIEPIEKGEYVPVPAGRKKILKRQEIFFQLAESKKFLTTLTGFEPDEFVLPYGAYNNTVIDINSTNSVYSFLSTCESGIDNGQLLKPRTLVTNLQKPDAFCKNIEKKITADLR